ncbi:TMEM41B [Cordylochernes scorpioides]|uniref:TMEM41B n=1 Tax=Cordylochernes scorpioides TaxID=51811 RepID=A0ABY6KFT4_9ARAC|nr:TMEM41B [Cordylochernes scorpioides]
MVLKEFPLRTGCWLRRAEVQHIRLPNNLEQARNLGLVLSRYTGDHFYTVFSGFVVIYIFLQTFAIPGSIFLSILSGYLFPQALALFLVCLCSATGASCCYLISQMVGRPLVNRFWPEKAASWSAEADKHRENFLSYMLFLRVTPFLPNWFINIASPIIDIPLTPFFIGTFFGVAPPSFLAIQTGTTLHDISLAAGSFSWSSFLVIGISAAVVLAPILFKNYFKSKME